MNKTESAELILKLYETRREPVMREARNWMMSFFPESAEGYGKNKADQETSAYYRMVTSYWDMAAAFVNHDAIDEEMFDDVTGEHIIVFSKIEPFLVQIREMYGNPNYLLNLEKLIMRQPNAREMLAKRREMMKRVMDARAETAKSA